jgi:hypothetical protein
MTTQNVSYALNNFGPWSDQLLAGIGGSAAKVNYLDPLASALPVIANSPGAFAPSFFLEAQGQKAGEVIKGSASDIPPPPGKGPDPASDTPSAWDTIKRILDPWDTGLDIGTSKTDPVTLADKGTEAGSDAWFKSIGKNALVVAVGLILLIFGLWILLYPSAKPILIDAAKAGA